MKKNKYGKLHEMLGDMSSPGSKAHEASESDEFERGEKEGAAEYASGKQMDPNERPSKSGFEPEYSDVEPELARGHVAGSGGHTLSISDTDGAPQFASGGPAGLEDDFVPEELDAAVRAPHREPAPASPVSRAASLKSSSGRRVPIHDSISNPASKSLGGQTSMSKLLERVQPKAKGVKKSNKSKSGF